MPAYFVFTRESTKDQGEMDIYSPLAGASLQGQPVKPLAAYGALEMIEGAPIEGSVILEFPTVAEARAWYDSAAYQEAVKHRHAGAEYRAFIIEGVG